MDSALTVKSSTATNLLLTDSTNLTDTFDINDSSHNSPRLTGLDVANALPKTKYKKADKVRTAALFAEGLKQCSTCSEIKSLDAFRKHQYSRHGLHAECSLCASRRYGAFQYKAEADALAAQGLKKCRRCLQIKSLDDFDLSATGRNGRRTRCRVCAAAHKASIPKPLTALTRAELIERIKCLEERLGATGEATSSATDFTAGSSTKKRKTNSD